MDTGKFSSLPDKKEEIKEYINNSDILPWSKKFLFKKLEKYTTNQKWVFEKEISSEEKELIKRLLSDYDNLKNKYQFYKSYLSKNFNEIESKNQKQKLISEVKKYLADIELNIWDKWVNEKIDDYIYNKNGDFIEDIKNKNNKKAKKKANSSKESISPKEIIIEKKEWILLWKITKEKWIIIKLLKKKEINYYNIQNSLHFIDISWFNKKYTPENIQIWSELIYKKEWKKHIIEIKPPLLVNKEQFEKENIPWTNKLAIDVIKEECLKYWIIPELYMSLIWVESSFWTNLRSNTWYIWYSMLRKDTSIAELLRLKSITKKEAELAMKNNWKTKENIIAWIKYFALLYEKFKWYKDRIKLSLAAYNWWPTKIKNIADNIKLPKDRITFNHIVNSGKLSNETKKYPYKILKIAKNFYNKKLV